MPREKIRSVKRPVAPRIVARVTWSLVAQLMASRRSSLCQSTGTRELFRGMGGIGKGRKREEGKNRRCVTVASRYPYLRCSALVNVCCKRVSTVQRQGGKLTRGSARVASHRASRRETVFARTLGGLQISQVWTGTPFLALLTRPVMGVSFRGMSPTDGWLRIGLMGVLERCRPPVRMEDDDAADPYPVWSIDSLLLVLWRRAAVSGRVDDKGAEMEEYDAPDGESLGEGPPRRVLWPPGRAGVGSRGSKTSPGLLT